MITSAIRSIAAYASAIASLKIGLPSLVKQLAKFVL